MLPYEIFFYGGISFLIGIFAASFNVPPFFITVSTIAVCALFLFFVFYYKSSRDVWFAFLVLFVIAGSVYYRIDDSKFKNAQIPFGKVIEFSGLVTSDPVKNNDMREMRVMLDAPFKTKIFVRVRDGEFSYGDIISGSGKIERANEDSYARYLEGQYIRGIINFPTINKVSEHNGSAIKFELLNIKHKIARVFSNVLPPEQATFLSGLTIGARGTFSPELKEAMQKSGTTHLVALSGYNISILVYVTMIFLLGFMHRRKALFFSVIAILGFVIMTGAEASVVRAAIIGFIILLSSEIGRAYDIRNVILFACLSMVLISPKVLVFDVGFELSFLALLGIIYINPIIMRLVGMTEKDNSFILWKTSLITTASAQITTLPILIANFGIFSPISLLSNVAILELIPITMGLGFMTALTAPISYYISLVFGLLVSAFLKFELFLIYFFAKISIPLQFKMSMFMFVLYYFLIGLGIWRLGKKITP
ncbi:MAG: ComEC/Rec2 family competence protein [bacterium]|nr:ComEC/Rec2 family competence protein [Candidatus Jorgensenbacteria bacterium]